MLAQQFLRDLTWAILTKKDTIFHVEKIISSYFNLFYMYIDIC